MNFDQEKSFLETNRYRVEKNLMLDVVVLKYVYFILLDVSTIERRLFAVFHLVLLCNNLIQRDFYFPGVFFSNIHRRFIYHGKSGF